MKECIKCGALLNDDENTCRVCGMTVGEELPQYAFEYHYDNDPIVVEEPATANTKATKQRLRYRFTFKHAIPFIVLALVVAISIFTAYARKLGGKSTPQKSVTTYYNLIMTEKYSDKLFDVCIPPAGAESLFAKTKGTKASIIKSIFNDRKKAEFDAFDIIGMKALKEDELQTLKTTLAWQYETNKIDITEAMSIVTEVNYKDKPDTETLIVYCCNGKWYVNIAFES